MSALAKLDGVLPFVSSSARKDLEDVRRELVRLQAAVPLLALSVIDMSRPHSLPLLANPVSQEDHD